ncbi:ATPases of the AAA+ class [hydrothermal vent metagenome]|uniref:ATPases of the AAA+ class n=1 Tax=hydrothermal vent metagenome TaxID=652676 RepID=A0A3B0ZWV8_9ZZZZ
MGSNTKLGLFHVKLSIEQFRHWEHKNITLLGMSGIGKTRLSNILREGSWFHYSGDYRIGSRYLDEPILDNIKQQAMQVPFLRDLLRSDSIYIANNLSFDNLQPVSSFLGKLGNPEQGGLSLSEFKRRQALHYHAEIAAMRDVPDFIHKSQEIYGYKNFINDAGGSVCELDDEETLQLFTKHTLVLYIQATEADEKALIKRAEKAPKPLYYREAFLDEYLALYMRTYNLEYVAQIDPDDYVCWVFPHLFYSRIPRYEAIAKAHGYTVSTTELAQVTDEHSFNQLIETAIERN